MTVEERANLVEAYASQIQTDLQREMIVALGASLADKTASIFDAVDDGLDDDAISRAVHIAVSYALAGMLDATCRLFPVPKEQVASIAHGTVDFFVEEVKEDDGQSFFDNLASLKRDIRRNSET